MRQFGQLSTGMLILQIANLFIYYYVTACDRVYSC